MTTEQHVTRVRFFHAPPPKPKATRMTFLLAILFVLAALGIAVSSLAGSPSDPYPEMEWALFGGAPLPPAGDDTPIALDSIAGIAIPVVHLPIVRPVVADLAATPLPVAAVPGLALDIADIAYLRAVIAVISVADTAGRQVGAQSMPVSALATTDIQTAGRIVDAWRHMYGANFDGFQQAVYTKPGDAAAMVKTARFSWWERQVKATGDVPAVALPESLRGVRWVAEMGVPASLGEYQNALAELAWFRARGYGGLLCVWSGETANLAMWHDLAGRAAAAGWKIAFAWGPPEAATETGAYFDPGAFQVAAAGILPFADCALLGWRAASQPHWADGNAAFVRVLASELRRINPGLPLIGEAYMHADRHFTVTAPTCAAGTLVVNAGVEQFVPAGVAGLARAAGAREPLLCLVTGVAPYWRTRRTGVDLTTVAGACRRTENAFLAAGWLGTVTLAGDGAGEQPGNTDSLCKSHWRDVQMENGQ